MTQRELAQYGCVREQVQLEIACRNERHAEVIDLAQQIRTMNHMDGATLRREAASLYATKKYKEALDAYLQSRSEATACDVFVKCPLEFDQAVEHYTLATYYRSAGRGAEAKIEMDEGDSEFYKVCPRTIDTSTSCDEIRGRLLKLITK